MLSPPTIWGAASSGVPDQTGTSPGSTAGGLPGLLVLELLTG